MDMKLAVIEGRWLKKQNTSIRAMFDLISDLSFGSPHGYHYETFAGTESFTEIVQRLGNQRGIRYLYVAAHGNEDSLQGAGEQLIPRRAVIEAFRDVSLDGVHFGACLIGRDRLANGILAVAPRIGWVAGYTEAVDFIASTAMDMVFWNEVACGIIDGQTVVQIRDRAIAKMVNTYLFEGLATHGFELYVRKDLGGYPGLMDKGVQERFVEFLEDGVTHGMLKEFGYRLVPLDEEDEEE